MTTRYAAQTTVPVGRTRDEIERTLARYGATGFMFGQDTTGAAVAFLIRGRHVRFNLPLPSRVEGAFTHTPGGAKRTETAADNEWQKAIRARWRALALIVKAKLEAIDAGVVTFDEEFLAHLVLPNGETVGQSVVAGVQQAYATGEVPALLPSYRPRELTR